MVKVTFKPWTEVVIHEEIEHSAKELIKNRVLGLRQDSVAQPLVWAEGVIFSRSGMPSTEEVIRDQLQGIIHFNAVEWALMPNYKKTLKSDGVTIPVIDVSNNPSLADVAKELKKKSRRS